MLDHIVGDQVSSPGGRVPVDPLIGVDEAGSSVVMDVGADHFVVVSAVLIQTRVVFSIANFHVVESHIVGEHDVDQIHISSPRPVEDQARLRHRSAQEGYVVGLHFCAARDDRHLTGIVREG